MRDGIDGIVQCCDGVPCTEPVDERRDAVFSTSRYVMFFKVRLAQNSTGLGKVSIAYVQCSKEIHFYVIYRRFVTKVVNMAICNLSPFTKLRMT